MPFGIGVWELAILLLVALLVFGPKRLPEMGRSLGRGMREFKDSVSGNSKDDDDDDRARELPPRRTRRPRRRPRRRRASATPSTHLARAAHHGLEAAAATPRARRGGIARRASRRAQNPAAHRARARSSSRSRSRSTSTSEIIAWLIEPLPDDRELVTLGVTEPFFTSIKVSFMAAFAIALPIVLYQLWSFLAPAVEENMQRVVVFFSVVRDRALRGRRRCSRTTS